MAMDTDKKLYIAVALLAGLGGAVYFQNKKAKEEAASYTPEGRQAELPKIELKDADVKAIDKVVINKPGNDEGGAPETFTLVKDGENWNIETPLKAKANGANVKSLIDNIKKLEVKELINASKDTYAKYKVDDKSATKVTLFAKDKKKIELFFGDGGGRGQMTRIAGKDGVYAVKGYSSFMYGRDLKGWRDLTIFKFEDKDATFVEVKNEHGLYTFTKDGDKWTAKYKKAKTPIATKLDKFDEKKVGDLLRAYKALNAADFGDDKKPADIGLAEPVATVTIKMKDDKATYVLNVGDTAEGSNRWVKANGSDQIYSVSSWTADWALAEPKKFQEGDDKKDGDKKPAGPGGAPPGLPPGMKMPKMPGH